MLIAHIRKGQGQNVIFMHGWGADKTSLLSLADGLQDEYTVTLVDFFGFGDTPKENSVLELKDYADSVIKLIYRYHMSKVILVGHSFGGRVAVYLSRYYPQLVEKMILIDSAGILPRRGLGYHIKVFKHRLLKKLKVSHEAGSSDYRALDEIGKRTFINIVNYDLKPFLPYITVPTLILWGREDKETPLYMARKFSKGLSASTLKILDDCGHFPFLEKRNECLYEIKCFLGGDNEF